MAEEPNSASGDAVTFDSAGGEISVRRGLKDRFESQIIKTFEVGGETELAGDWELEFAASFAQASEHEYKTQDPTRFRINANENVDGAQETDGIEVTHIALPGFPVGMIVAQDGFNNDGMQNFKYAPLNILVE